MSVCVSVRPPPLSQTSTDAPQQRPGGRGRGAAGRSVRALQQNKHKEKSGEFG